MSLENIYNKVPSIVRAAGELVMQYYGTSLSLHEKIDGSVYTEADIASENFIKSELRALSKDIPIISEESPSMLLDDQIFWLVDPLDGTDGFVKCNDDFVINIALIVNNRAIAGIVYSPTSKTLYSGMVGHGAIVSTTEGRQPLNTIFNKSRRRLLLYHPLPHNQKRNALIKQLGDYEIIRSSNMLRFCSIATGKQEIHLCCEGCHEWDTAAGHAILKSVGGNIITLDKQELLYGKEGYRNKGFLAYNKYAYLPKNFAC